jgi:lipopolysaccharide biosynthesis glycosyltransferase
VTKGRRRNAVALAADGRLFPAAAFAAERLAALNDRTDTDIVVFTNSAEERERAAGLDLPYAVRPVVAPREFTDASFFRLFVLEALSAEYRRIVYLDVDTWVESAKLFALFDLDMRGHPIAGVRDAVIAFVPGLAERERVLGPTATKYVNGGVLLVDAARYAADRMLPRLLRIIRKSQTLLHRDQSALNMLLQGDWLELSPAFNLFTIEWGTFVARVCPPVVVHFAGPAKPWSGPKFTLPHPARAAMEKYFPRSPWKTFLPGFVNLREALQPPEAPIGNFDSDFRGKDAVIGYLRETEFADVTAGIASLHLDQLPPRG